MADRQTLEPIVIRVPHDERVEPLVEIYIGRSSQRRLVTTIEVLSPTNKTTGEHGHDLYLRKQREILGSKVHLVEIDLLRGGKHTTSVPRDRLEASGVQCDYHVCIHRFDNLEDYFVYPIQLASPLPEIRVPLLPGDGEVALNLQEVFRRAYEAGPYRREIDYQHDQPTPRLSAEQGAWAQQSTVPVRRRLTRQRLGTLTRGEQDQLAAARAESGIEENPSCRRRFRE